MGYGHAFLRYSSVTGDWKGLDAEELRGVRFSPNVIRVIKSRWMKWVRLVARVGERRFAYRVLVGKLEGKKNI